MPAQDHAQETILWVPNGLGCPARSRDERAPQASLVRSSSAAVQEWARGKALELSGLPKSMRTRGMTALLWDKLW